MRVLSKAVQELELTWSPPEEPVRSKLDSWYFRSTRKADSRASVPFFPDVHEQLVKTWSAPQSAHVHSNTQAIFSHVDGAEAHGYVRSPPVEETVAAHLCPAAAKTLGSDISLPSKPCRTTAHLANKAYPSDGEAASALHAMAVLQVFQAKLLQAAEGGALIAEATKDLRANYGAFMCGCFRVVRGAKCITVSRDRHTHGSASTLYKMFVCLKMGSVCEMVAYLTFSEHFTKGHCTLSPKFSSEMFACWKINSTSHYVNHIYALPRCQKFGSGSIFCVFRIRGKHFDRCFDSSEPLYKRIPKSRMVIQVQVHPLYLAAQSTVYRSLHTEFT